MPATPAWPPKSLPRLFVRQSLNEGVAMALDANQANYLGNVLRLGVGAELLVFDGLSGEWLAHISDAGKKRMTLAVDRQTRESESIPDVWLAFAPVKRTQTDWLVEKSTELGVARLIPVMTQRTVTEHRDRGCRAVRTDAGASNRRAHVAEEVDRRARSCAPSLLRGRSRRRACRFDLRRRTGVDSRRPRRGLHRGGETVGTRQRRVGDLFGAAHSPRRNGRARGARLIHGNCGRLALTQGRR